MSSSSSTSPKKVILHADDNFIKHLYAEHDKDYHHNKRSSSSSSCTSFTGPKHKKSHHQHKKTCEIIHRRVSKFYAFFDPMMNFLLMNRYAMYNKQHKIDVETMPVDHIMVVHLIDCPSESGGRPIQLRIDKLEPRALSDLNEEERTALQRDVLSSKKEEESDEEEVEEFLLPHLVSYRTPNEGYIWTSIRTNSYDFNPLIIGRVSQKALMGRIIAFAQGINEIAKGERQDLYDMIKKQMKEVRRSKVAELPLRSVQSRERGGGAAAAAVGSATSRSCHRLNHEIDNDKENFEHNENTLSKDDDDDFDRTKLKELNSTTKDRIHEDEKTGKKV